MKLSRFIDTSMHQLFQGVMKSLIGEAEYWLSKHGKYSKFAKQANTRLDDVCSLQLEWCKALCYSGNNKSYTTGGWVAEGAGRGVGIPVPQAITRISSGSRVSLLGA